MLSQEDISAEDMAALEATGDCLRDQSRNTHKIRRPLYHRCLRVMSGALPGSYSGWAGPARRDTVPQAGVFRKWAVRRDGVGWSGSKSEPKPTGDLWRHRPSTRRGGRARSSRAESNSTIQSIWCLAKPRRRTAAAAAAAAAAQRQHDAATSERRQRNNWSSGAGRHSTAPE
jgi:hypothetical protein